MYKGCELPDDVVQRRELENAVRQYPGGAGAGGGGNRSHTQTSTP